MEIRTVTANGKVIAIVDSSEVIVSGVEDALDLLATVQFETGSHRMVLKKSAVAEDFYNLNTKLAGDILQKFINYQMKIALVGDYSGYASESLKAFIRESNRGKDVCFVPDEETAIEKLSNV